MSQESVTSQKVADCWVLIGYVYVYRRCCGLFGNGGLDTCLIKEARVEMDRRGAGVSLEVLDNMMANWVKWSTKKDVEACCRW